MKAIVEWFNTCKPEPKEKDITTQIGVHLEEVEEMLTAQLRRRLRLTLKNL